MRRSTVSLTAYLKTHVFFVCVMRWTRATACSCRLRINVNNDWADLQACELSVPQS